MFKPNLFINSEGLKYPPTAVGGIRNLVLGIVGFRKDLNDPPTAVGGIRNLVLGIVDIERT